MSTAAGRYAKALFMIASEDHRVREIRDELDTFAGLLTESRELREALLTPLHPASERKGVLREICGRLGTSPTLRNFYAYLIDQRRLIDFAAIHEAYGAYADRAAGLTTAQVISASPLDDRRKDRLRRALSERTGTEVRLEVEVDPSLIGGAIAKVGDLVFDGSLRTQLATLRSNLTKGS